MIAVLLIPILRIISAKIALKGEALVQNHKPVNTIWEKPGRRLFSYELKNQLPASRSVAEINESGGFGDPDQERGVFRCSHNPRNFGACTGSRMGPKLQSGENASTKIRRLRQPGWHLPMRGR